MTGQSALSGVTQTTVRPSLQAGGRQLEPAPARSHGRWPVARSVASLHRPSYPRQGESRSGTGPAPSALSRPWRHAWLTVSSLFRQAAQVLMGAPAIEHSCKSAISSIRGQHGGQHSVAPTARIRASCCNPYTALAGSNRRPQLANSPAGSNRPPPPYHGGLRASRAYTRDHSRHSSPANRACCSRWRCVARRRGCRF